MPKVDRVGYNSKLRIMRRSVLMFTLIVCLSNSSFAKFRIYLRWCNTACTPICWVIETSSNSPIHIEGKQKTIYYDALSAVVKGDKLVLTFDARGIPTKELQTMRAENFSLPNLGTFTKKTIAQEGIIGATRPFTVNKAKGVTIAGSEPKKDWPIITITIKIKF